MLVKKLKLLLFVFLLLVIPNNVFAINEVNIYFFHSDNCDICKQEKVYLDALKKRYPNIRVYSYETSDPNNFELMQKAKKLYNQNASGVPFTVIGDKAYLGFSQTNKALFQKYVYQYSINSYQNKLGIELGINYRNDLEGKVEEYKDNSDYIIEETSGRVPSVTKTETNYEKYKVSVYLITAGFILAIIGGIIHLLEKRGRI